MNQEPIDHHYVPVFYLKKWTSGVDKKMWYYQKNIKGDVIEGRINPPKLTN